MAYSWRHSNGVLLHGATDLGIGAAAVGATQDRGSDTATTTQGKGTGPPDSTNLAGRVAAVDLTAGDTASAGPIESASDIALVELLTKQHANHEVCSSMGFVCFVLFCFSLANNTTHELVVFVLFSSPT